MSFDKNTFGDINEHKSLVCINAIYLQCEKKEQRKISRFLNQADVMFSNLYKIDDLEFRLSTIKLYREHTLNRTEMFKYIDDNLKVNLSSHLNCFICGKFSELTTNTTNKKKYLAKHDDGTGKLKDSDVKKTFMLMDKIYFNCNYLYYCYMVTFNDNWCFNRTYKNTKYDRKKKES